jgi:hypothetical protein
MFVDSDHGRVARRGAADIPENRSSNRKMGAKQ